MQPNGRGAHDSITSSRRDGVCSGDAKRRADDATNAEKDGKHDWSPWCRTDRKVEAIPGRTRIHDVTVHAQDECKRADGATRLRPGAKVFISERARETPNENEMRCGHRERAVIAASWF